MFYTYVLKSLKDLNLYIGMTSNLKKRIKRHNEGREKSTKFRKPFELIFYAAFKTRKEAANFEKYLKTGSGKRFLQTKINI